MTSNPLKGAFDGAAHDKCPPDMPRGDSAADKAARQRFWIERGNRLLDEAGKHHLQWAGKDGHYWIEARP